MKRVLFVDDESYVLKIIERKFETTNIKCYFATKVHDAVEILKANDIDVMVTDIQMPDYNGIKFSKMVKKISPRTVRIILSGSSRVASIIEAINEGHVYKYIEKPWTIDQSAIELIEEAIQRSRKFKENSIDRVLVDVEDLNKFKEYEHWILVDTLDKVILKNSDYPLNDRYGDRTPIVIKSNIGQLKLYNAE